MEFRLWTILKMFLVLNTSSAFKLNERNVVNKVVIVTGSAQGIGYAIADNFLKNGAKNVIILDIKKIKGEEAEKKLNLKYGNKAEFIKCDVTKDLNNIYDLIMKKYGKVDVLINNVGIANENEPQKIMLTNTMSTIEWSLKFLQYMRKDEGGNGGTIINISSMTARNIDPIYNTYRASKLAILGFSLSLGHLYNYNKTGVRVLTLCPGATSTTLAYKGYCMYNENLIAKIVQYFDYNFQSTDNVGRGAVTIFRTAESGTSWDVKDGKPPVKSNNALNIMPFEGFYDKNKE